MNANLRNFALWVIIVLLLLALFTLFQNPGQRASSQDILVPTADAPRYVLRIGPLAGGRRILSDDFVMLDRVALLVARRIDAIRLVEKLIRIRAIHRRQVHRRLVLQKPLFAVGIDLEGRLDRY